MMQQTTQQPAGAPPQSAQARPQVQQPAAALPEMMFSLNVKVRGNRITERTLTARGRTREEFKANVDWLLAAFGVEVVEVEESNDEGTDELIETRADERPESPEWCAKHKTERTRHEREGDVWWSHPYEDEDGEKHYCRYYPPRKSRTKGGKR